MPNKKKYPITQRVELEIFGSTSRTASEVATVLMDRYREYILGRISFIVRTVSPDTCTIPTPGLELHGIPVDSITKDGDRIRLNSDDVRVIDHLDNDYASDVEMMEYICFWLEQQYVSPRARFIPEDPREYDNEFACFENAEEDDEDEEDLPDDLTPEETIHAVVGLVNEHYERGDLEHVAGVILSGAIRIISDIRVNPELALSAFSRKVMEEIDRRHGKEETKDDGRTLTVAVGKNIPS